MLTISALCDHSNSHSLYAFVIENQIMGFSGIYWCGERLHITNPPIVSPFLNRIFSLTSDPANFTVKTQLFC